MSDTQPVTPLDVFGGRIITRAYALEDINIQAGGDGRTVEAYATVFDVPAEIMDHEGHYLEVNDPHAFDEFITRFDAGKLRVGVFYNHGKTLWDTPSERGSVPIGVPLSIRAEKRGVLTVSRYNKTPLADEVLETIRDGGTPGYSYSGPTLASMPSLSRSQRRRGGYQPNADGTLQTVRRMRMGMIEYGPTPIPSYAEAGILSVRSQYVNDEDPDEDQDSDLAPDESDPAQPPAALTSVRHRRFQAALRARGIDREDTQAT